MKWFNSLWFKIYTKKKLEKRMIKYFNSNNYNAEECIAVARAYNFKMYKICDELLTSFGY
jgi:hypothetical protein